MSEKNKNRKDKLSDFLRYRQNRMTDAERNLVERNLQKDPFSEEGLQGFESIDPESARKDILRLKRRLNERTRQSNRAILYRIAASIAVLMIISSVFIIILKNQPKDEIAYAPVPKIPLEIRASEPLAKQPENITGNVPVVKTPEHGSPPGRGQVPPQISPEKGIHSDKTLKVQPAREEVNPVPVAAAGKQDEVMVSEAKEPDNKMFAAPVSKSALAGRSSPSFTMISGKVISAEDNQPIPGVSINIKGTNKGTVTDPEGKFKIGAAEVEGKTLVASFVGMVTQELSVKQDTGIEVKLNPDKMALNEVVVVGYGAAKAVSGTETEAAGYTPPKPVNGMAYFQKYIENNIVRPDGATSGQRVVVVLGFLVDKTGKIDSIKIIRSPGKSFSDEAIRLVSEGPAWKPAERDGKPTADDVRVRIVFK